MDVGALLDSVRLGAGAVLIVIGSLLLLAGVIGALRFPDLYTRLHASLAADSVGAVLVVLGLAFAADGAGLFVRLLLLALLIALIAPTLTHFIANAAHTGGVAPLSGRYVAPRPGARSSKGEGA